MFQCSHETTYQISWKKKNTITLFKHFNNRDKELPQVVQPIKLSHAPCTIINTYTWQVNISTGCYHSLLIRNSPFSFQSLWSYRLFHAVIVIQLSECCSSWSYWSYRLFFFLYFLSWTPMHHINSRIITSSYILWVMSAAFLDWNNSILLWLLWTKYWSIHRKK